jgi:hypothetical protein
VTASDGHLDVENERDRQTDVVLTLEKNISISLPTTTTTTSYRKCCSFFFRRNCQFFLFPKLMLLGARDGSCVSGADSSDCSPVLPGMMLNAPD